MPSLTRKIAHNTIYQVVSKTLATLLGLVTVGILTRYLGQNGFGQFTTIQAFMQFFAIAIDLGLSLVVVQMISEAGVDVEKTTNNIFTFRLVTAIFCLGLAPIVVIFFPYDSVIKLGVALTTFSFLFSSLNQILTGLFQKNLRMEFVSLSEVASRVVLLLGVILIVWFNWGLLPVMGFLGLGNLVSFLILLVAARTYVKIALVFDWDVWHEVWRRTWPVALSIIFNLVYFKADTLILSLLKSQSEVGIYGAAYKILEVMIQFIFVFMGLILPLYSFHWAAKNKEKFQQVLQKAWDFISIISFPMICGALFLARPIMTFVAGDEFAASALVFQILIFAVAAIYFSNIFTYAIVATHNQKKMIWGFAAVAVISLVGYLYFIPRYSYIGAAGMTVLTEVLVLLISAILIYRETNIRPRFIISGKALAAALFMGVILYMARGLNFFLEIIVAATVYFVVLCLIGGVQKETIKEIFYKTDPKNPHSPC